MKDSEAIPQSNLSVNMPLGVASDTLSQKIMNGFKINWMNLKNAETGKVLWECQDWDSKIFERTEYFPRVILSCRSVGRAINFSSKEKIDNFKLLQRIWLFDNVIEEWDFDFGFVIPGSTNTWEQVIDAAEPEEMLPLEVISGNMIIETLFFNKETIVYRSKMKVIYR